MSRGNSVGSLPINSYGVQDSSLIPRYPFKYGCETIIPRFPHPLYRRLGPSAAVYYHGPGLLAGVSGLHRDRPQPVGQQRDWILRQPDWTGPSRQPNYSRISLLERHPVGLKSEPEESQLTFADGSQRFRSNRRSQRGHQRGEGHGFRGGIYHPAEWAAEWVFDAAPGADAGSAAVCFEQ